MYTFNVVRAEQRTNISGVRCIRTRLYGALNGFKIVHTLAVR